MQDQKTTRQKATFRLKPVTIQKLKKLAEKNNTTQSRIIDNAIEKESK